jgi:toxin-antitoxin system PIN domain toxin
VLLALLDTDHTEHQRARAWMTAEIADGWASCAITQNGFVRVVSQARYPSPISPSEAIDLLSSATSTPHHEFWECSVSILDRGAIDRSMIHRPRQVTDAYLLALATDRGGRFVTFDQAISLSAVSSATRDNLTVL